MDKIIEAAQEVFEILGAGHSESVYESALEIELVEQGFRNVRRQVPCPIYYKGYLVGFGHIDMLIDNTHIVELKTVTKLTHKDETQLEKYITGMKTDSGLIINFNPGQEEIETVKYDH